LIEEGNIKISAPWRGCWFSTRRFGNQNGRTSASHLR